jgi:hypothetical protein
VNAEPERFRIVVRPPRESEWWDQARSELDAEPERVPELARPLLGTEVRSELMSREDALTIHKWAESLPGWGDERRLVLLRHPSQATVDWRDL